MGNNMCCDGTDTDTLAPRGEGRLAPIVTSRHQLMLMQAREESK
jgi:hypothetical protein